jgi:hypothetical protein
MINILIVMHRQKLIELHRRYDEDLEKNEDSLSDNLQNKIYFIYGIIIAISGSLISTIFYEEIILLMPRWARLIFLNFLVLFLINFSIKMIDNFNKGKNIRKRLISLRQINSKKVSKLAREIVEEM